MGWDAWYLGGLLVLMVGALASGRFGVDLVVVGVLAALLLGGVVEPAQAFQGFSNPALLTVGFLYIVAAGMRETGAITQLTARLLGRPKSERAAQARLVLPVTVLSAFANNTPIVASFLPVINSVSRRAGLDAGKLYMPLSFSAILGGVTTLIGTSTTLVVAGLIQQHNRDYPSATQLPEFGMFTIAAVGVPIAVVGVVYMLVFGRMLLPSRAGEAGDPLRAKQFMTAMRVSPESPVVGKTVEQAGLRHLPGLFLSRIERDDTTVIAVSPEEELRAGDILVFVGVLSSVVDLQTIRGLVPVTDESGERSVYRPKQKLIQAVISNSSPLVGRTIRDAGLRSRYEAVVVAVHRQGARLRGKVGDITLRPGDTLLLEAGPHFAQRYRDSRDFHLVSEMPQQAALRHERAGAAMLILAMVVVVISTGMLEPVVAAMAGAAMMILTRCCTGTQARASVDWQVLAVIGAAFGIGRAMEETGLADAIAGGTIGMLEPLGPWALLGGVYALTVVFTMFLTNNAAAVLMFPIAYAAAAGAGLNFVPFAVCIAVAASCEFSTPIGYQTNLMVMGPGGYRWLDYTRFGLPLTILAGVIAVAVSSVAYGPLAAAQ